TVGFHHHWLQSVLVKQEFDSDQFAPHFKGRSGGNYRRRAVHHNGSSSVGPGSFPCTRCGKVYNWRGNLLRHMRLECGKAPQFQCSYCPYETKHKNHLQRHVTSRHKDVLDSLQEQQTQHFYQTEQELQPTHMSHSTISSAKKKAFSCPRCNKVYNWRTNLRRHIRLECGKAPQFHCSFCPYKTKQKAHLTRHIAGRHRYLDLTDYAKFPYDSGY
ncbi:hypothetical protein Cfor_07636, partial [Coptotermes formosanus]